MRRFSFSRWWGIVLKEFLQLRRDRITFGMVVGIPIIQIVLFGYAINSDPKQLPTTVVMGEDGTVLTTAPTAVGAPATSATGTSGK